MFAKKILLLSLLLPGVASASVADDIARIRPLLPAGQDVAQVQVNMLQGNTESEAIALAKSNYLFRDFNGDGREDLLVISEDPAHYENYQTNQPCSGNDEPDCMLIYGKRYLRLYVGQADGSLREGWVNDHYVLAGDEGGVFGDPLNGISVRKNGSIELYFYGGSAWRWSYTDVIQYRKGDLYVVGQDSYSGWTGDLRSDTKSVNLLTGQVIETHQKNGDAPIRTKRYRVATKPLENLRAYSGPNR